MPGLPPDVETHLLWAVPPTPPRGPALVAARAWLQEGWLVTLLGPSSLAFGPFLSQTLPQWGQLLFHYEALPP